MKKFLREPVVHFAALGILLFVYFDMTNDDPPNTGPSMVIVVTDPEVVQIIEGFRSVWRHPPNALELEALIDEAVREEVMVREALELGLDRGDAVIRNRLRRKMQFLTDSVAQTLDPDDAALQAHMDAKPDDFLRPELLAFEQVYLGETASELDAATVLARLAVGEDPATLGQRSLLPTRSQLVTRLQVDGAFGGGFFDGIGQAEAGEWSGPYRSGYGLHLIRITNRQEASMPELSAVRDKVLFDWRRSRATDLAEAQYSVLRERYQVTRPEAAVVEGLLAQ